MTYLLNSFGDFNEAYSRELVSEDTDKLEPSFAAITSKFPFKRVNVLLDALAKNLKTEDIIKQLSNPDESYPSLTIEDMSGLDIINESGNELSDSQESFTRFINLPNLPINISPMVVKVAYGLAVVDLLADTHHQSLIEMEAASIIALYDILDDRTLNNTMQVEKINQLLPLNDVAAAASPIRSGAITPPPNSPQYQSVPSVATSPASASSKSGEGPVTPSTPAPRTPLYESLSSKDSPKSSSSPLTASPIAGAAGHSSKSPVYESMSKLGSPESAPKAAASWSPYGEAAGPQKVAQAHDYEYGPAGDNPAFENKWPEDTYGAMSELQPQDDSHSYEYEAAAGPEAASPATGSPPTAHSPAANPTAQGQKPHVDLPMGHAKTFAERLKFFKDKEGKSNNDGPAKGGPSV